MTMADITIGSNEIQLIKQQLHKHFFKLRLLNRSLNEKGVIIGKVVSGNITIDSSSDIRRTANLSMVVDVISLDTVAVLSMDTYLQINCGLQNNSNDIISWYNMGIFAINQSGFSFDPTTRTLNLNLSDLTIDLIGQRAGTLHAYTSLVKNEQDITDVIINVLELAGFTNYDIEAFSLSRDKSTMYDTNNDFEESKVPYDMNFSVGVTAYEIISKLVHLYPYYQMYFDTHGTFVVERDFAEQDPSSVVLDDKILREVVHSEETSIDWTQVKNYIEVWGKDGKCYGEAKDDNPLSPFNVQATQALRYVVSGGSDSGIDTNNICDKYKDAELQSKLERDQATQETIIARLSAKKDLTADEKRQLSTAKIELSFIRGRIATNIAYKGDDLAKQWAEYILYQKARMNESITLQTVFMPFVTDTNFKISYMSKIDNKTRTYLVKSVSHDLTGGSTTLNCIRFYNDNVSAYWEQLPKPIISSYSVNDMLIVVNVEPVQNATLYQLMLDHRLVASSVTPRISYELPEHFEGEHTIYVRASAEGWKDGSSDEITVELTSSTYLVTNDNDNVIDNNDNDIITSEGG